MPLNKETKEVKTKRIICGGGRLVYLFDLFLSYSFWDVDIRGHLRLLTVREKCGMETLV